MVITVKVKILSNCCEYINIIIIVVVVIIIIITTIKAKTL